MRDAVTIQRDMHDYLPRYYEDIPVATNVIDREAVEMAQLNADIYDVLAQMFIDTSTWGLARWERIFGITTDVLKPIDQRRSVIKSRIRGVGTVTPAMIKSIAEAYANGDVEVTEAGTNMLPPFNSGWTLHENTRMRQANFVGKIGGSVSENPHKFSANYNTSLIPPSGTWYEQTYPNIASLNGVVYTSTNSTNLLIAQQLFSFNLIEHVIRNYGVGVFGAAVTTAERVAWLKANVAKFVANWHGFGSSPAGNKATFNAFAASGAWSAFPQTHTSGTIAKLTFTTSGANVSGYVNADGFVYFLAYADASNGTVASTINTDFVELEVYMAAGSVPVADYELTLNATANSQTSTITVPVLPNTVYTLSAQNGLNASVGGQLNGVQYQWVTGTANTKATFTTGSSQTSVYIQLSNGVGNSSGVYTFTNPQLERGSVRTPFENLPDYTIGIKFVSSLGIPANMTDLIAAVRDALPAHLAVNYVFMYKTFGQLEGYGVTFGAIESAGLTFGKLETWEGP